MPWNDWQFLLASAVALIALGFMLWPLMGRKKACNNCGPSTSKASQRTALTIGDTERESRR